VEDAALFCHLVGALVFVAGIVLAGTAFESARRRREPAEIDLLLRLARLGAALVGIGMLLLLVFGLWLVHLGHWGFGAGWVDAALALFAVAAILGGLGGVAPRRARQLAGRLAAEGRPPTDELRALLDDRAAQLLNYASLVAVIAILALMVWKPGSS
jgi:uncharacterized membrane protein